MESFFALSVEHVQYLRNFCIFLLQSTRKLVNEELGNPDLDVFALVLRVKDLDLIVFFHQELIK